MNRYKLAVLASHPIQYQAPLFRKLAARPELKLMVYFCSDQGVVERREPEFGVAFKWDVPLLEGYSYKFLKNYSPRPVPSTFGAYWWLLPLGISNELKMNRYNAVMIQGYASAANWLAYLAAWMTGTPVLLRGETVLRPGQNPLKRTSKRAFLRFLFKRTDAFLPIGTKSTEFYEHYGVPGEKQFLTPYSVDNEFFLEAARNCWRGEVRGELAIPEGLPIILCVSKLADWKRPVDLLRAFEHFRGRAALAFVGEGELRVEMERWVKERDLKGVHFLGFKNQSEISRYYAAADIFVIPSAFETWGIVVNEAMCFGLPVVATQTVAAARDLVRQGENGFVYPVGDLKVLVRHLEGLVSDAARRKEMGQASLKIIRSWNCDASVEGILEALHYVTGKPAGAP